MRLRLLLFVCVIAMLAGLSGFVSSGSASELSFPTAQLRGDYGEALPYATPPATPAGLCLIDSGVDLNPDTQPVTVYREALDGGTPDDVDPMKHGTLMAMEAAAVPGNDWGTIGAAPGAVRIVSIRVMEPGGAVSFSAYKQAILRCKDLASVYNIKVISLSLGYPTTPTETELLELEDAAVAAQSYGLSIVAAVGNEGVERIDYPAAAPQIIAVGAADQSHLRCPFSNWGAAVALLAPGCGIDSANPLTGTPDNGYYGTSQATVTASAVLAALDAYRPALSPQQSRHLLTSSAAANDGELDVTALFQAAGLASVLTSGEANEPKATQATSGSPSPLPSTPTAAAPILSRPVEHTARLPRPRVRLRRRQLGVVLSLLNLPPGAQGQVMVLQAKRHGRARTLDELIASTKTIVLKSYHHVLLMLTYLDPSKRSRPSPATYFHLS